MLVYVKLNKEAVQSLTSPNLGRLKNVSVSPTPTPLPPQAPKTFKFDSSTDLKQELEKINPQVLDSDFE